MKPPSRCVLKRHSRTLAQPTMVAGPSAEGWLITAIFDTKTRWEQYRADVLEPRFTAGIDGAFATGPDEIHFEVVMLAP